MDYLDFEVRIGANTGDSYPVLVVKSPVGELSATTQLPLGNLAFKQYLQTVEHLRSAGAQTRQADMSARHLRPDASLAASERDAAEAIGRALFDVLLPPNILSCYRRSRDEARRSGKWLRLRLRIEAPDLAILPWEFLFDAADGDHVSLNKQTPLMRYLELERPIESLMIPPPIRILGMVASPRNQAPLNVAQEKKTLVAALDHLIENGTVELDWVAGQTVHDLDTDLSRQPWHILHFIGHGSFDVKRGEGYLVLADESGNPRPFTARELGSVFARQPALRLVVLNACEGACASETNLFSSTGSVLVQRGIPAVISMQYAITDRAALEFARNFYDALARKLPVDAAVTEARYQMRLTFNDSAEWGTPVLYMRARDGNLFELDVTHVLFPTSEPPRRPSPTSPLAPPPLAEETQHGLGILRRKVQQFWIEGVLEQSLFQHVLIDLGMTRESAAVDNPLPSTSTLERPGSAAMPIPPNQTLIDIFNEEGNSLLILGEPGSGKTTIMLGLVRALLARCEQDPNYSIPTVFNLSSWVEPQRTILDWLVDELSAKYQIPKKIGRGWLQAGRLLPLLDGLDELRPERRAACIEAINSFTQEAGFRGAAVCCRLREYLDLPVRLTLNAAVRLQLLSDKQVQDYLVAAGERLAALRTALQRDSALRIDARSPLMLNLMMCAYQDSTVAEVLREGIETTAQRRQELMAAYEARRFRRTAQRSAA